MVLRASGVRKGEEGRRVPCELPEENGHEVYPFLTARFVSIRLRRWHAAPVTTTEALTDIEQEHNGLYYYDRRPKFDVKRLHSITSRRAAYERGESMAPPPTPRPDPWKILAGTVQDGRRCTPWRYVTETPLGDWTQGGYNDSDWRIGPAPFGQEAARQVRTAWTNGAIYLRKEVDFTGGDITAGAVIISHGGDAEVFVNGQKILGAGGRVGRYFMHDVTEVLRRALRNGMNVLAVHARQSPEGQFIDVGVIYY